MRSMSTLASYIENASINIIEGGNQKIIECQMEQIQMPNTSVLGGPNKIVFTANHNCSDDLGPLLLEHFVALREPNFNFSEYEFDHLFMHPMHDSEFISIHLFNHAQSALNMMVEAKEKFILLDLNQKQTDKYLRKMNDNIRFLTVVVREAMLRTDPMPRSLQW